jgi:hypothetical protein
MKFAFATCAEIAEGWPDDRAAAKLLDADFVVWDDPGVDWELYDRVVLRSVWDFTWRLEEFLGWCRSVGSERLRNRPDLVEFNADKHYLKNLSVPVIPTVFVGPGQALPELQGEVVIKPSVSAGARSTGRFTPALRSGAEALVAEIHARRRVAMIQPHLTTIECNGETAMIFLGGTFSHAVSKKPILREQGVAPTAPGKRGVAVAMLDDDLVSATSARSDELALAQRVVDQIGQDFGAALYSRVDLVTDDDGTLMVLELELIEPALYLGASPAASSRFAKAALAS